eukprot:2490465-Rhodomonas_salina.2
MQRAGFRRKKGGRDALSPRSTDKKALSDAEDEDCDHSPESTTRSGSTPSFDPEAKARDMVTSALPTVSDNARVCATCFQNCQNVENFQNSTRLIRRGATGALAGREGHGQAQGCVRAVFQPGVGAEARVHHAPGRALRRPLPPHDPQRGQCPTPQTLIPTPKPHPDPFSIHSRSSSSLNRD